MLARLVAKPRTCRASTAVLAVVRVRVTILMAAEARVAVLLGQALRVGSGFVAKACAGGGARTVVGGVAVRVGDVVFAIAGTAMLSV